MATQHDTLAPQAHGSTGAHARSNGSDRSVAALMKELLSEGEALARAEAALVKTEMGEKIATAQRGIAALITGGATLAAGMMLLLFAAVFALDRAMELWQAALIVGGAVTVIGAVLLSAGKRAISAERLIPERTIEELKLHKGPAKEQAR